VPARRSTEVLRKRGQDFAVDDQYVGPSLLDRMITYHIAATPEDFAIGVELFKEYAASLPIDLSFQDLAHELQTVSFQYCAPVGALLLVYTDGAPAGCAGIRQFEPGIAELKRMYLRDEYRGLGIGQALLERCLTIARDLGHQRIRLDTLANMAPALGLYRKLGFREIPAYRFNPIEDAVYMEKVLRPTSSPG
jgi:putative acetyltransferase